MTRHEHAGLSTAQRKKMLIAQGAMYRLGLIESRSELRANLRPDVLARSALHSLVTTASGALGRGFDLRNLSGANLQTVLPLLVSAVSLLAKRRSLIKPVLVGVIALVAASGIARFALRKKRQSDREDVSRDHDVSQSS